MSSNDERISVSLEQARMTNWYAPIQLAQIALRSMIGDVFGAHTDRREIEHSLSPDAAALDAVEHDHSGGDEIWIDYVADLGDGWDATYSVAWLLAQDRLSFGDASLPRGEILIMGGDQVYPIASRDAYHQKLVDPYRAALPWSEGKPPKLLAVPGNHDWYDGLTSFLRVFCQRRWLGGRLTAQRRSYFAVKLPHDWWLWAVDIQLEADIDAPQKAYFGFFADRLGPGSKVILCTPVSTWVDAGDARIVVDPTAPGSHPNLEYLEAKIKERGARLQLTLAGDLHHYSRYESVSDKGCCRITAGGGGAFMHGTHELPDELALVEADGAVRYRRRIEYPSQPDAKRMRWRNLAYWYYNPAFSSLLAIVYLMLTWIWQSTTGVAGPGEMPVWQTITGHPAVTLASLFPIAGMLFFASAPPRKWKSLRWFGWGIVHGIAHIFAAAVIWQLSVCIHPGPVASICDALMLLAMLLPASIVLGGTLFGFYLALSSTLSGMHDNDVFASLHSADRKNFLRLHVSRDGLTVHPFKVERVCRSWKLDTHAVLKTQPGWWAQRFGRRLWQFEIGEQRTAPWFQPVESLKAEPIEKPVVIR